MQIFYFWIFGPLYLKNWEFTGIFFGQACLLLLSTYTNLHHFKRSNPTNHQVLSMNKKAQCVIFLVIIFYKHKPVQKNCVEVTTRWGREGLRVRNANSQHKKRVAKAQQVRQRGGQRRGCHWWPLLHRSWLSSPDLSNNGKAALSASIDWLQYDYIVGGNQKLG